MLVTYIYFSLRPFMVYVFLYIFFGDFFLGLFFSVSPFCFLYPLPHIWFSFVYCLIPSLADIFFFSPPFLHSLFSFSYFVIIFFFSRVKSINTPASLFFFSRHVSIHLGKLLHKTIIFLPSATQQIALFFSFSV